MAHTEIIALRIFYFMTFVDPLGSKKIMFRYNQGQYSDNNLLLFPSYLTRHQAYIYGTNSN